MKQLQTILITGSLPYKLEIVKIDKISSNLGEEFTKQILLAGLFATQMSERCKRVARTPARKEC